MSRVNKQLIKAGLSYLIDKDKESFIDNISIYLRDKTGLMDFLFEGPLPINQDVESRIVEYIKSTLPCPEYFDGITKIEVGFTYDENQEYEVTYRATRFYDANRSPWNGMSTADAAHQIEAVTELTTTVSPSNIKI